MSVGGTYGVILSMLTSLLLTTADVSFISSHNVETKANHCPFVYDARVPSAEVGLINCTWYSSNTCCKRTEVTSVFSDMLPLDTPSSMDPSKAKHCRNLMNYMMCYFCDPNQASWYSSQTVKISRDFCTDVHSFCSEAAYNGKTIGEEFANGDEFCEAQKFMVVSGDSGCFKFDPTVFDSSTSLTYNAVITVGCLLLAWYHH